jgi:hypothetical protein
MEKGRSYPSFANEGSLIVAVCIVLTGCVSHQSIESKHDKIAAELEPGDRVELELKDGQKLSFRVTEIRETELVGQTGTDITRGEMITVQYKDIKRLERVDQRPLVLIGSAVAIPFVLIMIFLAFFASAAPA